MFQGFSEDTEDVESFPGYSHSTHDDFSDSFNDARAPVHEEPAKAEAYEKFAVTYGSVIKLKHAHSGYRLHSHTIPYGTGSGQQSVTSLPEVNSGNSYWVVQPEMNSSAHQGDVISTGSTVRLLHMGTQKWLHSHLLRSPLSGNLEVSAFGSPDRSDTGDNWRLEIEDGGRIWVKDQKVRLHHVDTNGYLHSHNKKYSMLIPGQQEVCGVHKKNADNIWLAAEGIYLPTRPRAV